MTSSPQIRLRTIFLLFFCAAVGLTTSKSPSEALSAAAEVTIAIGLLQQARQLLRWRTAEHDFIKELAFARRFAIFWRLAVAVLLAACVFWLILLAHRFATPPDRGDLLFYPSNMGLPQLCVLIALCSSCARWRITRSAVFPRIVHLPLLWILGAAIASVMLIDGNVIQFLIHRALHGIESAQKPRFQRTDLYIPLSEEGYFALWLGAAALGLLFAATLLAIHLRSERAWPAVRRYRWPIFVVLLIPAAAFCVWYYRYGFYRLSPDMASVGFAITRPYLLLGALLATAAVTAGAYKMAVRSWPVATVDPDLAVELDRRAFHESFVVLILLVASAVTNLCFLVSSAMNYAPAFGSMTFRWALGFLCDPSVLLVIATLVATIQLCWLRWKARSQQVPWLLPALSPRIFSEGWFMLASLVVTGIPTIQAFVFLLSTTPYHIPSSLGY